MLQWPERCGSAQALKSCRFHCGCAALASPNHSVKAFVALWKHRQGAERSAQRRGTSRVCRRGLALSAASFYTVQVLLALATKRLQADRAIAWRLRWQPVPAQNECASHACRMLWTHSARDRRASGSPSRAQERTWHATGLHRHVGADQSSNFGSLSCIELLVQRTGCRKRSSGRCAACRRRHRLHLATLLLYKLRAGNL